MSHKSAVPENELYEKADVIGIDLNPTEKARVALVLDIVHESGPRSVLDVGCGDGRITNAINAPVVIGTDFSRTAMEMVERGKVVSTLPHLPFDSGSFDMVLCTEVIEHLDQETYVATVQELKRVASRHILITAPLGEVLAASNTKCTHCGRVYQMYHHKRSFRRIELARLDRMMAGFKLVRDLQVGMTVDYTPSIICRLDQTVCDGFLFWDGCVCPGCGRRNAPPPIGRGPETRKQRLRRRVLVKPARFLIRKGIINPVRWFYKRFRPYRHKWHFVRLYQRAE